jgi:hypothetical protein
VTLTRYLPTLRSTIADPLTTSLWPEHTVPWPADVTIAGVSLVALAQLCDTPCIHTEESGSVVVARVTDVTIGARMHIELDADLSHCDAIAPEARLIGRASHARGIPAWVLEGTDPAIMPAYVHPGDLIAVPCRKVIRLQDVRFGADGPIGRCGR